MHFFLMFHSIFFSFLKFCLNKKMEAVFQTKRPMYATNMLKKLFVQKNRELF